MQVLICVILSCPYIWFSIDMKNAEIVSKFLKASPWLKDVEGTKSEQIF